jgi:hypothetical protein
MAPPLNFSRNWNYFKLCVVVIAHSFMYIMNTLSPIYLIIYEPWYVACPLITVIASPLVSGVYCAFNNLENSIRMRLGLELLNTDFSIFYFRKIKKWFSSF